MKRSLPFFLLLVCIVFHHCYAASASQLKSIDPETQVLIFNDSRRILLDGIHLESGAFKVLASLLSANPVEIDPEAAALTNPEPVFAIVYVQIKKLSFPVGGGVSELGRIDVGEFLLRQGLATVVQNRDFKNREKYLKIQEDARAQGVGLWSRQPILKTK